jgi:hypothetical protein
MYSPTPRFVTTLLAMKVWLSFLFSGAITLSSLAAYGEASDPSALILSANQQQVIIDLVDPVQIAPTSGKLKVDSIDVVGERVRVTYGGAGDLIWQLFLSPADSPCEGGIVRGFACVQVEPGDDVGWQLGEMVLARMEGLAQPLWLGPSPKPSRTWVAASATVQRPDSLPWWGPVESWATILLWLGLASLLILRLVTVVPRPTVVDSLPFLGLAAATFGLRLAFATWGPGDLRQPDDSFIGSWAVPPTYGATVASLGRLFAWLPVGRDRLLVLQSLLLSSCAVLPLWGAAKKLSNSRITAWLAAGTIATQPLLVRFSGEANRQGVVLFLGATALWALLRSSGPYSRLHAALGLVSVALLLGTRPEAFLYIGFLALLYLLVPIAEHGPSRWRRLGPILLMVAMVALQLLRLSAADELGQGVQTLEATAGGALNHGGFPYVPAVMVHLNMGFTPLLYIGLYALGWTIGFWRQRAWVIWSGIALVLWAFPLAGVPRGVDGGMQLASARYQTLSLIPFSLVMAYGAQRVALQLRHYLPDRVTRWVLIGLGVLALAATMPALLRVTQRTSLDNEYRFLRESIVLLPQGAEVFSAPLGDSGLSPPTYLPAAVGRPDVVWRHWPDQWQPSARPQFLATQSACALLLMTPEKRATDRQGPEDGGRHECTFAARYVAEFAPEPLAREAIELRPFVRADFSHGDLEIGIYPLEEGLVQGLLHSYNGIGATH